MRGRGPVSPVRGRADEGSRASGARTGAFASLGARAAAIGAGGGGAAAAATAARSARSSSSTRSTSLRWRAAASARARASRSSLDKPRGPAPADLSATGAGSGRPGLRGAGASLTGASATTSVSVPPGPASLRVLRFSTTTDFERPWLKFCRTWPLSTVRCSDSGLREAPRGASETRLAAKPSLRATNDAVSASITSVILWGFPPSASTSVRSTAGSAMRLASSWMVIASGIVTSRVRGRAACAAPRMVLSPTSLVSVMRFSSNSKIRVLPAIRMHLSPTDSALSAQPRLETA